MDRSGCTPVFKSLIKSTFVSMLKGFFLGFDYAVPLIGIVYYLSNPKHIGVFGSPQLTLLLASLSIGKFRIFTSFTREPQFF